MKPALPRPVLMLVTEAAPNLADIVSQAVAGGVNVVQLRHRSKDAPDPAEGLAVLNATVRGGARLILNGVRLGKLWDVSGFHFPETYDLNVGQFREIARGVVGKSVHSVAAALRAAGEGADYLVAGTVYASQSHPGEVGQGIGYLREVCAAVAPLPVIAIGGITQERVVECIAAGAAGVAVLSPILRAVDPAAVARAYREELDKAWNLRSTEKP